MVKIDDETYKEIIYANPRVYSLLKKAKRFIKINFFTIPTHVVEEKVAIMFKTAGSERGEKTLKEVLYIAEITGIHSKSIGEITDDEAAILGYRDRITFQQKLERRLKGLDARRLCIVTEFKKIKNLEDFMDDGE